MSAPRVVHYLNQFFAGVGSEERGISEAIARNMREMFLLTVPIIVVNIGEGGSGGAIGIGVGDRVLMLEHAIYSVIPPESCAAIIWRDAKRGPTVADLERLLRVDRRTVARLVKRGQLPPPLKLGGSNRLGLIMTV